MKKLKVIIGVVFLLVLVVVLSAVINNIIHFEKSTEQKEKNTLILTEKFNFEEIKKVGISYKNPNKNMDIDLVDIDMVLTGEDALDILNSLKNVEYTKITGLMWRPIPVYTIDLFNGTQILYDDVNDNIVQYQDENEKFFTELPVEVKEIISKYVDKELDRRTSLYYTDKIILKSDGYNIELDDKVVVDKIIEECKNNVFVDETPKDINIKYELIFNENLKLNILEEKINGKSIAQLYNKDEDKIVYVSEYLVEVLSNLIANTEKDIFVLLNTNVIGIQNGGITSEITDVTIIEEIIQHIMCSKIDYNNIVNIESEKEDLKNDTLLNINNNQLIVTILENGTFNTAFITLNNITYTINVSDTFISLIKSLI